MFKENADKTSIMKTSGVIILEFHLKSKTYSYYWNFRQADFYLKFLKYKIGLKRGISAK